MRDGRGSWIASVRHPPISQDRGHKRTQNISVCVYTCISSAALPPGMTLPMSDRLIYQPSADSASAVEVPEIFNRFLKEFWECVTE